MKQRFRYSICDPFKPDEIDMGEIETNKIMEVFDNFPWERLLCQMKGKPEEEIHYSPSLEIENVETRHGVSVSAVGEETAYEFYIFYKRPKIVKSFFGLKEKLDENYLTDVLGQRKEDARRAIQALLTDDTEYLEEKIKRR
jgi:hypothetical protein